MNPIVGHDAQFATMRAAAVGSRLHHAWLLHGPKGIGKASFAKAIGTELLAASADADVQSTASLIAARSHPDFILMEREVWRPNVSPSKLVPYADRKGDESPARSIRVDQVRWLGPIFSMAPSLSDRRVVVIDAIDDMERSGANALLKMLEEPPASTIFLLVSHAPGRLLPTIRSRCRALAFDRLTNHDMEDVLAKQGPEIDALTRAIVIAIAEGAPGAAGEVLAADVPGIDAALRDIATSGDPDNVIRLDLAGKLSLKAATNRYEAFLRRAPAFIADHARSRSGTELETALSSWEGARTLADVAVAQSLPPEDVVFSIAGRVAALAPEDTRAKA